MRSRNPSCWPLLLLLVLGAPATALAGGVRIVERPTVPPFITIQGAIDAALDGETLLVGQGSYAPFTVNAKSISVIGEGSGLVTITGTVTVQDLASSGAVLFGGLTINGQTVTYGSGAPPGIKLANNAGHVRVEGCTIKGGRLTDDWQPSAGAGAEITDCPKVAFVGCTLTGNTVGYCGGCSGAAGGNGITATNGGVVLYDCTLKGGRGSDESFPGGDGGHGYLAQSWGVVASGCTMTGGSGGGSDYTGCDYSGSGGDGVRLVSAQIHVLDDAIEGGPAGSFSICGLYGSPGQPINNQGGFVNVFPGVRRKLTVPIAASDHAPLAATVTGEAGDRIQVFLARGPYFLFVQAFHGTWLVPYYGFLAKAPLVVLSSTGPTNFSVPVPNLPSPEIGRILFVQALAIDAGGGKYLSSPQHVLLLNRDAQPDCNVNGVLDFIDTVAGLGSVPDANNDFIPDVCGGPPTVHWVDASAPPGGDGSVASPFQAIRTAVDVSLSGHTVIVRDGLYTGVSNREIDFGGRDIVVQSENGPANCVIDCQGAGRAFIVKSPATLAARIAGFTILNGSASAGVAINANLVTVSDCVFESCASTSTIGSGGAISASRLDLRRCEFRDNTAGSSSSNSSGGAIYLYQSVSAAPASVIQDCSFEGNTASRGGAIYVAGSSEAVISHCTFMSNTAWVGGGAIFNTMGFSSSPGLRVDDCLFAGNVANLNGGAITADASIYAVSSLWITDSTFAGNSCPGGYGGALSIQRNVVASVANCILWGDSAAQGGAELSLRFGSPNVTVSWCDVQGGLAGVDWAAGSLIWGSGNLDLDPQFNDPDGPDNDPFTYLDNDYTLSLASPCIDAGDSLSIPADWSDIDGDGNTTEPVPLDLLLAGRRVDVPAVPDTGNGSPPVVDMGAYEHP